MAKNKPNTELNDEQEQMISGILSDIVYRLGSMPVPPEQRRDTLNAVLVNLLNATGVPNQGTELYDQSPAVMRHIKDIADIVGNDSPNAHNHYAVSHYKRPGLGSSGAVFCHDTQTDDDLVLLVRTKKCSDRWTVPAGFMDFAPDGGLAMPARGHNMLASAHDDAPPRQTPAFDQAKPVLHNEYRRLLDEEGWSGAESKMTDEDYVRDVLKRNGIEFPLQPEHGTVPDLTPKGNFIREVREETGIDLTQQGTVCKQMQMALAYGYTASMNRDYTVNPRFWAYLGDVDGVPKTDPQDKGEITEAVWVPIRNIVQTSPDSGVLTVKGITNEKGEELPLGLYSRPIVERGLNALLSHRIHEATQGCFDSPRDVYHMLERWQPREQARAGGASVDAIQDILRSPVNGNGHLSSLMGEEGQKLMREYVEVARAMTPSLHAPDGQSQADKVERGTHGGRNGVTGL